MKLSTAFWVVSSWVLLCLVGALPYYISGVLPSFADAFFESVSGFSTTGATVFTNVEILPRRILFWRSMTQWLGGMGLVILFAVLAPFVGAEAPGPEKGKITPRITDTAKKLWLIYVVFTVLQIILMFIGGLDLFDSVTIAFTTMSTGGFSTKNASIAGFNSAWVEWVCIIFMIIAGFNFNLIFKTMLGKGKEVIKNSEARVYIAIIIISSIICAIFISPETGAGFRKAMFQCVSVLTTTGFSADNHNLWNPMAQAILFMLMFIGACSYSTGSGVKVVRFVILFKQMRNELRKQLNPRGVFSIQLNKKAAPKNIVYSVAGFVFLYFILVIIAALAASLSGADVFSSFNLGLLLTGNIGLGIFNGSMEQFLFNLPAATKWLFSFIMLAGRLELWTVFALFYIIISRLFGLRSK